MSVFRDERGRFKKGCKAGPGRPKSKTRRAGLETFSYRSLRDAWLVFKTITWYTNEELLKCSECGNKQPDQFVFRLDKKYPRIRYKCLKCGIWRDFEEKVEWFIRPPDNLTKDDAYMIAMQRKGKAPMFYGH